MKHIKQYFKAAGVFAFLFPVHVFYSINLHAQSQNVGINYTGAAPNASALLDIDNQTGPAFKGLLIPRVTAAQRTAMNPLPAAAQGLVVYQTDGLQGFYYNTSATTTPVWVNLIGGVVPVANGGTNSSLAATNGTFLMGNGTAWVPTALIAGTGIGIAANTISSTATLSQVMGNGRLADATGLIKTSSGIDAININSNYLMDSNSGVSLNWQLKELSAGSWRTTGNFGVKTTATEALDVLGNVKFSGALMPGGVAGTNGQVLMSTGPSTAPTWTTTAGGSQWINGASSSIYYNAGNVGIGVISPADKFHVQAAGGGIFRLSNDNASYLTSQTVTTGKIRNIAFQWNSTYTATNTYETSAMKFDYSADVNGQVRDAALRFYTQDNGSGATQERMSLVADKVGIGITSPAFKLDVAGTIASGWAYQQSVASLQNSYTRSNFGSNVYWDDATNFWHIRNIGANDFSSIIHPNGGGIVFLAAASTGTTAYTLNNANFMANEKMRISANGSVGIGTASPDPNQKLTVNGDIRLGVSGSGGKIAVGTAGASTDYLLLQDIASGNPAFQWVQDGSPKFTIEGTTGNVGIGTTSPGAKLDIAGNIKIADGSQGVGKVLTSDVNGVATWTSLISSGTYTPSLTYNTNIASATAYQSQYMQVGRVVTVSGNISIQATTENLFTKLIVSLPVPSSMPVGTNSAGGSAVSAQSGPLNYAIQGYTPTGSVQFVGYPSSNSTFIFAFSFTYLTN